MAKKKAEKDKLPKKIAGVKVPKELRKSGGDFAKFIQEPLVREIALAALAAALAARKDVRKASKKAAMEAGEAAGDVGEGAGWLKAALGAAAMEAGRMVIDAIDDAAAKSKTSGGAGGKSTGEKVLEAAASLAGGARR